MYMFTAEEATVKANISVCTFQNCTMYQEVWWQFLSRDLAGSKWCPIHNIYEQL